MGQVTQLSLADGQDTPVVKSFDVAASQEGFNNPAIWYEKTNGSFAGYKKLSMLVNRRPNGSTTKVSVKLSLPETDVENVVTSSALATVSFVLPDNGSVEARKDILAFIVSFLSSDAAKDAVHDLVPQY